MPPLVATTVKHDHDKPDFDHDGWLEKVNAAQEHRSATSAKCNIIQRTLTNLSLKGTHKNRSDGDEPGSYRDELKKHIAESNANLCDDEQPQDSSDDDSEQDLNCPRNAETIDFSESIVSLDSVESDYVEPPVEVPSSYRIQDRHGGVLVAGKPVTFTNWEFKRQLRYLAHQEGPIPERGEVSAMEDAETSHKGVYTGKIVEL